MIIERNKKFALVFVLIGILNIAFSYYEGFILGALWFCSTTIWFFALGLFLKNDFIISSTLTASFFIEFIWTLDYVSFIITGNLLVGIAEYLLSASDLRMIATLYHLAMFIFPIIAVFEIKKLHKYSWIGASGYLAFIFVLTLILTKPGANMNCVYRPCPIGIFDFLSTFYQYLAQIPIFIIHWAFLTIAIFIPTHYIFKKIVNWVVKDKKD